MAGLDVTELPPSVWVFGITPWSSLLLAGVAAVVALTYIAMSVWILLIPSLTFLIFSSHRCSTKILGAGPAGSLAAH